MIKIVVLVPLLLSLLWIIYLKLNGYSLAQGKQGFGYILAISSTIGMFFVVMLFLTR